jgi:hypothetical protein
VAAETLKNEAPGAAWRELLEHLYTELEDARTLLLASTEREAALVRIIEADRAELQHRRQAARPQPPVPLDATPRPAPPRERSSLHRSIVEVLAAHPDGLSAPEIASALHTSRSLGDVLCGMVRRGHVTRPRSGVYALPVEPGVHAASRNGVEP